MHVEQRAPGETATWRRGAAASGGQEGAAEEDKKEEESFHRKEQEEGGCVPAKAKGLSDSWTQQSPRWMESSRQESWSLCQALLQGIFQ